MESFFAEIAAWSGAALLLCISYYIRIRATEKKIMKIIVKIKKTLRNFQKKTLENLEEYSTI